MEKLSKQPLVEVIFELHWKSNKAYPDPDYRLIIGAFYEHIKNEFPVFEPLPTANIPEEAIPPNNKIIQYRFWSENKAWPVVQLGPGIVTVNMNNDYEVWDTFKSVIEKVVEKFFNSHPDKESLVLERLSLKYLDFFQLDFLKDNILNYLKSKLHINLSVDLGADPRKAYLSPSPVNIDLKLEHQINKPEGVLGFRFFKAPLEDKEGLVMESYIVSREFPQVSLSKESISTWLDQAHELTDFIFSNLIRGELMEELK